MEKCNKFQNFFIPIVAILGIITTIKLNIIYYNANFVPDAAPSFCVLNETIDCDGVARTEYSRFLGVPLSLYGLLFYLFVIVLHYAGKLSQYRLLRFLEVFKNPNSYIFSLSAISVVVSVILAGISSFEIHKICILCYVSYVLNFLLLIIAKQGETVFGHLKNCVIDFIDAIKKPKYAFSGVTLAGLAVIMLILINQFSIFAPQAPAAGSDEFDLSEYESGTKYKVSGNILGDKNAKVFLHEYTDFKCHFCKISNAMLHKLVREVKGVQVIHHDFPLDKACNPIMKSEGHKGSCMLARYSLAAKKQNKLWDFNSAVFDRNGELTEEQVLELAKELNMDVDKLKKDANSPEIKAQLFMEIDKSVDLGMTATPTYRIGMKLYEGLMSYDELKQKVIEAGAREK